MRENLFLLFAKMSLLLLCFASCENDLAEINRLFSDEDTKKEIAKGVTILYSDSAILKVKVIAPVMERFVEREEPRQIFPNGLRVEFYDERGKADSWLTAKNGTRYEKSGRMVVTDSVVWQSVNLERLESEELIWDEKLQKVHTNKFVVIKRPGEIIYGYGFEANQDFSKSTIRAIEGKLKVDELDESLKD